MVEGLQSQNHYKNLMERVDFLYCVKELHS